MYRGVHLRKAKFSVVREYSNFSTGTGTSLDPKNKNLEIFRKVRILTDVLKVFNLWPQLWRCPKAPKFLFFAFSNAEFNFKQYSEKKFCRGLSADGARIKLLKLFPIFPYNSLHKWVIMSHHDVITYIYRNII